jgi:hypothetical protein
MTKNEFIAKHKDYDIRYRGIYGLMIAGKTGYYRRAFDRLQWQDPKFTFELEPKIREEIE